MERFLSVNQLYWVMPYHYNAFLVPIIFCGGVDGALRVSRWLVWIWRTAMATRWIIKARTKLRNAWRVLLPRRILLLLARAERRIAGRYSLAISVMATVFAAYVAVYAWSTFDRYPMHHMTEAAFWDTSNPSVVAAKRAASKIPDNVYVSSATQVGPQLLSRDKVVLWGPPGDRHYPPAPWVLADEQRPSYPFKNVAAQQAEVQRLESVGYRVVFQRDGWIVLHNAAIH
jgi:hypothetical protein